jgi:hypothetical protein
MSMRFFLFLHLLRFYLSIASAASLIKRADEIYDYIVVGGGTSGNVVANRLSEDAGISVVVIEAGPVLNGQAEFDELLVPPIFEKIDPTRSAYTWPNITSGPVLGLNGKISVVGTAKVCSLSSSSPSPKFFLFLIL